MSCRCTQTQEAGAFVIRCESGGLWRYNAERGWREFSPCKGPGHPALRNQPTDRYEKEGITKKVLQTAYRFGAGDRQGEGPQAQGQRSRAGLLDKQGVPPSARADSLAGGGNRRAAPPEWAGEPRDFSPATCEAICEILGIRTESEAHGFKRGLLTGAGLCFAVIAIIEFINHLLQ